MDEQLNAREQGDIKHNEGAANPGGNGFGSHGEARPAGRIERIKAWVSDHRRESWPSWVWWPCFSCCWD